MTKASATLSTIIYSFDNIRSDGILLVKAVYTVVLSTEKVNIMEVRSMFDFSELSAKGITEAFAQTFNKLLYRLRILRFHCFRLAMGRTINMNWYCV